ncbi:YwqG family protein [Pseudobacillus badius]|uniref:YwqG family protein n=1 Tax=Bacillus badius TaxID=1455 RepID=UPI003CE89FF1
MTNLDHLLHKHELYHKKPAILSALKHSIGMEKVKMDEEDIPIGSSKLGGLPDMPDSMEFPRYENGHLSLLGQFNLKEAKPYDKDQLLPENGILYLFYDVYEQPWGFEEEEGGFKLLYYDGEISQLKRRAYPETNEDYFPLDACKVSFNSLLTISEHPDNLSFAGEEEEERFWSFRQDLMQPEDEEGHIQPAHYMLGEPLNIQNNVFEDLYDKEGEPVLLLQIDSDEEDLGVMWGDSGILYFCMERKQLANKQFDQVAFTLQCF